jgi:hypothetical protein
VIKGKVTIENHSRKTPTLEDSIGKAPGLTYAVSLKSPSVNITLRQLMGKSNIRFSFAAIKTSVKTDDDIEF